MPTQNFKVGEMLNKRTPNSKTWMNFDGSYTTEIHSGVVHYEDVNGNLQNIDTDLQDEADFDQIDFPVAKDGDSLFFAAKEKSVNDKKANKLNRDNFDFQGLKVPFETKLPRNIKRGYSIGKGASKLAFIPVNASPSKGYVEGNKITYQDVWNDADLILEVLPNGIKETIILKSERAPFNFSFEVQGELDSELKIQPPWLQDAAGVKRDVVQGVEEIDEKTVVSLAADVSGLVYPIEIDPTVTLRPSYEGKDTYIDNSGINDYDASVMLVGALDPGLTMLNRAFLQLDLSTISGYVSSATLNLYNDASNGGTFYIYRVLGAWTESAIYWASQPAVSTEYLTATSYGSDAITIDVTNDVRKWVDGTNQNNGWSLRNDNEYPQLRIGSSDNSNLSYKPSLSVTYYYAPAAPTVITPNGGETWNSSHTLTWNAATDQDTASGSLRYQIQLSTNNGSTWKDIVALTLAGATSYAYDFINEAESSTAKIRIRAYDGSSYGAWDESNGVFTIQHNQAPTAPTNLTPASGVKDRAAVNRLSWQHNDANADPQAKFDLQWRVQGASTWNDVTQTTVNQYYDAPANIFPKGTIEWRVRTYDQAGLSSPYSAIATFFAGDKPAAPTITAPGASVAVANPTVQWSSVDQTGYKLMVKQTDGTTVFNAERTSTNKAETITYNLANQTAYDIELSIKNADGLYSNTATLRINVSYTPPAIPDIETVKGTGYIQINITDQVPSGTQPAVTHHEIYKEIDGEFVMIATGVANEFKDYQVASKQNTRYFVRTFGDNGTFSDTITFTESITFTGVWLHIVDEPSTLYQFKYDGDGRGSSWGLENAVHRFAGRRNPVMEIGEMEDYAVNCSLKILDETEREALERIVYSGETVCYRDGRGRKAFGVFVDVPLNDEKALTYSTSLTLMKIDFKEAIV